MSPLPLAQLLARIEKTWGPDPERDQVLTLSPTPGALVEHVGADPSIRQRAVDHLLRHLPEPLSSAPDLAPLLDQCLDAGREVKPLLHHLAGHRSAAVRRRLFDRLWPLAQARTLPASWTDVTPADLVPALVQVAPSPDLLTVLLDVASDRDWDRALIGAVLKRPTPHLVPALERWSDAHPTRQDQLRVQAALGACRRARPWSLARPSPLPVPTLRLPGGKPQE